MTIVKGKTIIGAIWFVSFLVLFLLLTVQTFGDVYGDENKKAWEWFLPHIAPTLAIILAVAFSDYQKKSKKRNQAEIGILLVMIGIVLSLAHLGVLGAVLVMAGNSSTPTTALELMQDAALPLGALQTFIAAVLTFFFQQTGEPGSAEGSAGVENVDSTGSDDADADAPVPVPSADNI